MLFFVLCLQEFIPRLGPDASFATFFIYPLWFFCSAVTLSYPVMLGLAFFAGLFWDLRYTIQPGGTVPGEATFGMSILLFGILGSLMHGVRPLYQKRKWALPILLTGACLVLFRVFDYLLLNFKRGDFLFPSTLLREIFATALITMALSPLVYILLHWLSKTFGYHTRYPGYGR